jgi:hypothetical protein
MVMDVDPAGPLRKKGKSFSDDFPRVSSTGEEPIESLKGLCATTTSREKV